MSQSGVVLKIFVDQCVPDSAGRAFTSHGHDVVYLREALAPDSPDFVVASVAESNDAILLSLDGDFKVIAQRHGMGRRAFRKLSLIKLIPARMVLDSSPDTPIRRSVGQPATRRRSMSMGVGISCRESRAAERIALAMSIIEHEWMIDAGNRDRRLFIEIGDSMIRINR